MNRTFTLFRLLLYFLIAGNVWSFPASAAQTTPQTGKIPIEPQRWYQLTNASNGLEGLFDGRTDITVNTGWGKVLERYDAYYPLAEGEEISIERIRFYDGKGTNKDKPLTLSIITDTWERIPIATFTGEKYNTWVGPTGDGQFQLSTPVKNARYLVINSWGIFPTEMELYGTYTPGIAGPMASAMLPQKPIKLKDGFGINAFEWDIVDGGKGSVINETKFKAIQNFSGIRHYMDWERIESTEGSYSFNPTASGGWDYDLIYKRLKEANIDVLLCLKTIPKWMKATYPIDQQDDENVPLRYGKDLSDPKSYIEQAKAGFQLAARYGSNNNINSNLQSNVLTGVLYPGSKTSPVRTAETGMNLIKYIECDNERNKYWKGRKAYQTGREYAANLSAFYDGHKNTMGPGVGVKNADPNMQVVMGGLAGPDIDYVKGMIDWCREFRGYKPDGSIDLCWDVINYHSYQRDESLNRGIAPELSSAGKAAAEFIKLAQQHGKGMPVWLTETGYDSNQASPNKAIAIGGKSVLETQADWILRTALLYNRLGVEKVFSYQTYDYAPDATGKYGTMGLLNKEDKSPRPAAVFLNQARKLMGDYIYKETISNDPVVDRYELNGRSAYVLVIPDEKGRTANYTLDLNGAISANVYTPTFGQDTMKVEAMPSSKGIINVTVTETPIFIIPSESVYTQEPAPATACTAAGFIHQERWDGVKGGLVAGIPLANAPSSIQQLTLLEGTTGSTNYGQRMRGYICAPQTGEYNFYIAGDDQAELWLSSSDDPAQKQKIAFTSWRTASRAWTNHRTQQSAKIILEAGKRYYIEVLHKQGWGEGHVAAAWKMPDGTFQAPIAGEHLSPFDEKLVTYMPIRTMSEELTEAEDELMVAPNPIVDMATVLFSSQEDTQATVALYDLSGRLIQQLYKGTVKAMEPLELPLEAAKFRKGIYLIKVVTPTTALTKKVLISDNI